MFRKRVIKILGILSLCVLLNQPAYAHVSKFRKAPKYQSQRHHHHPHRYTKHFKDRRHIGFASPKRERLCERNSRPVYRKDGLSVRRFDRC